VLIAAAVVVGACGSGSGPATGPDGSPVTVLQADPSPRPDLAPDPASAASPLPAVTVRNVSTGEWVRLADFLPAERPVLLWFWAPH
jgi:hypothetical protein